MGIVAWVAIGVIVLVAIGLGWGVFFSGLFRGAQVISENPVVQNATKETIESADKAVDDQLTSTSSNNVVVVHTEKTVYKVKDPVVIVVKNEGNATIRLSDSSSSPNVEITNKDTGKKYDATITQVKTELEPGDTVTVTWDQTSDIESGTYVAIVKADDGTTIGETTFTVET
jgi:hypothetical protein